MKINTNKKSQHAESNGTLHEYDNNPLSAESVTNAFALENAAAAIVFFKGPLNCPVLVNKAARNLWNDPESSLLYMPLEALPGTIRNFYQPHLQKARLASERFTVKNVRWMAGEENNYACYYNLDLVPLVENEHTAGILCTAIDVTQEVIKWSHAKKNEREIRDQFHLILNAMPLMIAYIDGKGRFRYINKMFEAWIGQTNTAVSQRHMREIFSDESFETLEPHVSKCLQGGLTEFKCAITVNKQRSVIEGHYLPYADKNNSVAGFFAILIDVTERRHITHTVPNADGSISAMRASLNEMSSTIYEISKKLDVAKVKLRRAGSENQKVNDIVKRWTSDLQVSEAMTGKVKTALEHWLTSAA
jgi:PAS domain S-box-containing protein